MRDTWIGITTMTLLFGLVWLSQNKANTNKEISYNNSKPNVERMYATLNDGEVMLIQNYVFNKVFISIDELKE